MALDEKIVLGLDIGVASVGWALVRYDGDQPIGLVATGVRRFETGTDGGKAGEAGIAQGRDESRAKSRRTARGMRRQIDRRSQRIANTLRHLQSGKLLPPGSINRGDGRHDYIVSLDKALMPALASRLVADGMPPLTAHQEVAVKFPYLLRARALTEKLSECELGRAFLHLAQRRGFKSNRKEEARIRLAQAEAREKKKTAKPKEGEAIDKDDPLGTLEQIKSLRERMKEKGAATLGTYLASLNPHETRIRTLRTSRDMFESEFEKIVAAQATYHAIMKDDQFIRRLRHALFYQRDLRSARCLRGRCELVPNRRCIARATLLFQRYRMITEVNNLIDGGVIEPTGICRRFSDNEKQVIRQKLYEELARSPKLTLAKAAEEAGLPKKSHWGFEKNEDFAKGKRLPGLTIAIDLAKAAPDDWARVKPEDREKLVSLLHGAQSSEKLTRLLQMDPWFFALEEAKALTALPLEEGYGSYSRAAIEKLLPLLEKGMTLPAAIKTAFGDGKSVQPVDRLPGLKDCMGDPRNPAVTRSLTELRKVVNHIVRRFGKPDLIRVELARDLKRGREERQRMFKANEKRRQDIERVDERAREKYPSLSPGKLNRRDRIKWQLAEECGWICPYSGGAFDPHDLFEGHVEVEHIIPRSQYGKDDFPNLTLCINTENAIKNGKTPWQAYSHDQVRWEEILGRVRRFKGDGARSKLALFQMEDAADEAFAMRHLNDTRYAALLAVRYLGRLYGYVDDPTKTAAVDPAGKTRVQSNTGGLTSLLRRKWLLMGVMDKLMRSHPGAVTLPTDLSTDQREELNKRVDHRHHAMDAIVVALTTPRLIQRLADIAREAELKKLAFDRLPPIPDPWRGFLEDVENMLSKIVVSQRPDRRINGPLHKETNYSRPIMGRDGKQRTHLRVHINNEMVIPSRIPDKAVREAVEAKLNGGIAKKVFVPSRTETLPVIGKGTSARPIKRVRIVKFDRAGHLRKLGQGHVQGDSNDHMVIYQFLDASGKAKKDRKGQEQYGWKVCSTFDAMDRLRKSQPIVQVPSDSHLIAILRSGDYFQLSDGSGQADLYVLDSISDGDLQFRLPHLLPPKDKKQRKLEYGRPRISSIGGWLAAKPKKMGVSPLGEVTDPQGSMTYG